jgi:hypothetical protein
VVTNMSQTIQIGSGSSGATAKSQSAPQARTPLRVILDLVTYTIHGLQIQQLQVEQGTLRLQGNMRLITEDFLKEVTRRGWVIHEIRVSPQYALLEVVMVTNMLDNDTPTTQISRENKYDGA